jgi:amidase
MAVGQKSLVNSAEAATVAGENIISASASELAAAIRSKEISSKIVVEAYLDRIAKVNPKINAVVQLTADSAREAADQADAALARGEIKGALHGVPVTIKDTLETKGVICTGGTKGRANYIPGRCHRSRAFAGGGRHYPWKDQRSGTCRRA